MSGIQDKVVAITGASGAIGQATARLLAGRGAKLMLGARRIGPLNALAREIVEAGGSAHYQALDVTLRASMQCFIDEATAVFGRVDVIVDNTGVMPRWMRKELEIEERVRMLDNRVTAFLPGVTGSELADSNCDQESGEWMRSDRQVAIARAIVFAIEQPAGGDRESRIRCATAGRCAPSQPVH
jgi:NADP-dependent 3-hydroxy acid dehydrogenase YdfG